MQRDITKPGIIDVYTDKPQYLKGQEVKIIVEIDNPCTEKIDSVIVMSVSILEETIFNNKTTVRLNAGGMTTVELKFLPRETVWQNFGIEISLVIENKVQHTLSTAFDAVTSWKEAPRYGFLSGFYKDDENDAEDVKQLVKYHINVMQFYDWMYRHDNLIPDENYFIDPLGRQLSLKAVKDKINICHEYGIKTLAYGAVYAASEDFYKNHEEWGLYRNNGTEQSFGNWLYIMNISPESPWQEHIVNEFKKAVEVLDFDGIHMDTFGWPKSAFSKLDGNLKFERLQDHFPALIESTRKELGNVKDDIGLFFNAVSNWPVEILANQKLDAIYIEVWDPCERYIQLNQLISHARELGKKPVILAAYLSPFSKKDRKEAIYVQKHSEEYNEKAAQNCFLLSSSVVFASGGYHFLLGEHNGILTNNYYVEYGKINNDFERIVRNYFDFIVRYGSLLFDQQLVDLTMTHANGINDEYRFANDEFSSYGEPDKVWTIVKEKPGYKTINLINLTGIKSDMWNEGKENKPIIVENICISALIDEEVIGVFIASPDIDNGKSERLEFEFVEDTRGRYIKFIVPKLEIWNLIYIKVSDPK